MKQKIPYIIILIMMIILFQGFLLSDKIRTELRFELSMINLILFPLLILLNICYCMILFFKKNSKGKFPYIICSLLFYIILICRILNS